MSVEAVNKKPAKKHYSPFHSYSKEYLVQLAKKSREAKRHYRSPKSFFKEALEFAEANPDDNDLSQAIMLYGWSENLIRLLAVKTGYKPYETWIKDYDTDNVFKSAQIFFLKNSKETTEYRNKLKDFVKFQRTQYEIKLSTILKMNRFSSRNTGIMDLLKAINPELWNQKPSVAKSGKDSENPSNPEPIVFEEAK